MDISARNIGKEQSGFDGPSLATLPRSCLPPDLIEFHNNSPLTHATPACQTLSVILLFFILQVGKLRPEGVRDSPKVIYIVNCRNNILPGVYPESESVLCAGRAGHPLPQVNPTHVWGIALP